LNLHLRCGEFLDIPLDNHGARFVAIAAQWAPIVLNSIKIHINTLMCEAKLTTIKPKWSNKHRL